MSNVAYRFALLDSSGTHAAESHNDTIFAHAAVLGIGVEAQRLAARCFLRNIAPEHDRVAEPAAMAAIALATTWTLPPHGAFLVTSAPTLNAVGAMAVLVLRAAEIELDESAVHRIRCIAEREDVSSWSAWFPRDLPTQERRWPDGMVQASETRSLAPLVDLAAWTGHPHYSLAQRVFVVALWLLHGEQDVFPDTHYDALAKVCRVDSRTWPARFNTTLPAARVRVEMERDRLIRSIAIGTSTFRLPTVEEAGCTACGASGAIGGGECPSCYGGKVAPIAIVESSYSTAAALGHCLAPFVVARNPEHIWPDGTTSPRITVSWWRAGMVDREKLFHALNAAEPTDGGPAGDWTGNRVSMRSPHGSKVDIEQAVAALAASRAKR